MQAAHTIQSDLVKKNEKSTSIYVYILKGPDSK